MEKVKWYYQTHFAPEVLTEAAARFIACTPEGQTDFTDFSAGAGDEEWVLDDGNEFYAASREADQYHFLQRTKSCRLEVLLIDTGTTRVLVSLPSRGEIETVFDVLERNLDSSKIVVDTEPIKIFVGHGRDPQWRDLRDHLCDQHGLEVIAYEIGPRAGLSVKEVLEDMLTESSFALLVLTGEDEQTDGSLHARQNVVHELGLFQGRLGFTRAIAMLEEGVAEFSNILGVNQLRFAKGHIRETFGDVVATLHREFEANS